MCEKSIAFVRSYKLPNREEDGLIYYQLLFKIEIKTSIFNSLRLCHWDVVFKTTFYFVNTDHQNRTQIRKYFKMKCSPLKDKKNMLIYSVIIMSYIYTISIDKVGHRLSYLYQNLCLYEAQIYYLLLNMKTVLFRIHLLFIYTASCLFSLHNVNTFQASHWSDIVRISFIHHFYISIS